MTVASPYGIANYHFSRFSFNLPFSFFPQFSNLSALIKSSFTPQRLITELTGVTNVGLVESN